jgi:hypothetical protein
VPTVASCLSKAVLLNLLSVVAAYGVLVLVFQRGIRAGLLGRAAWAESPLLCRCSCS